MTRILTILGVALGLVMSAQAADPFLAKFKPGKWEGQVKDSVSPSLKGKKIAATTEVKGDEVLVTVVTEGANGKEREEWKVTPTQLIQTEFDAQGKKVATYAADARSGTYPQERIFDIHCTDRAAKKCDNNIDPNNHWVLKVYGEKLSYVVRGLKDKNNPKSFGERHLFEFKYAGTK